MFHMHRLYPYINTCLTSSKQLTPMWKVGGRVRGSCQKPGGRGAAGGEGWLFVTPPVWFRLSGSCDGLTRLFAFAGLTGTRLRFTDWNRSTGLESVLGRTTDTPHTQYFLHIKYIYLNLFSSFVVTKTTVTVLLNKIWGNVITYSTREATSGHWCNT